MAETVPESARDRRLSLIGVGRLGLCLALVAERAGYDVLGVDVLPQYVESINRRTLHSAEPHVNEYLRSAKRLRATTDMDEAIEFSDHLMILVATPSTGGQRHYDVTQLSRVLMRINARRPRHKVVTICCTVLPGYIANIGRGLLADCDGVVLQYNPEFIQQGNIVRGLECPDTVLIGEGSGHGGDLVEQMWRAFVRNPGEVSVHRMSAESAEIAKLALNCYITMKISFANTIADVADRTPHADKHAILQSIGADTRVGAKCLLPGYGFGGPCFPRDNRAFGGYAESVGIEPLLSRATDAYNERHAQHMAAQLLAQDRDLYVFEGVTYKVPCDVPIIEESQKLVVAALVARAGKRVVVRDRKEVIEACKMEWGSVLFEYQVIPGAEEAEKKRVGVNGEWYTPPRSSNTGDIYRDAALNALDARRGQLVEHFSQPPQ
ncbi:hypothetical protein CDCA_CDCA04G1373 [Cyanidium caldarium]|uniref:UDP-glucose 6-dehydrogenase n=1 Tax=Cyanidium caldarium TaxID=2771 RepID=A0AAV9ISV6_CYACA|nr:hypothetical protein CDCA_CDCA04G1373 [Cyanidium caldarium]